MRKSERLSRILSELRWRPHIRAAELADQFNVSSETIRRDLQALSKAGQIDRAYGGASARYVGTRPSLDQRKAERIEERDRIARSALEMIADGETLMIDAGSTTMAFARCLAASDKPMRVITNSLQVALVAGQSPHVQLRICPGDVLAAEAAVVGADALDYLGRHNVATCVLGASALNRDGISEAVPGFAPVKRAMMAQAKRALFLIDHSKFGQAHLDRVTPPYANCVLCVDRMPDAETAEVWTAAGRRFSVAPEGPT